LRVGISAAKSDFHGLKRTAPRKCLLGSHQLE
jgi:hypothetical protein